MIVEQETMDTGRTTVLAEQTIIKKLNRMGVHLLQTASFRIIES